MFLKMTVKFGKPVCVALYSAFAYLLAKGKWIPIAVLAATHFCEYLVIGFRTAKEKNLGFLTGLINCLAFGFTWWLPLRKDNK